VRALARGGRLGDLLAPGLFAAVLLACATASAHPLGMSSINRYAGVSLQEDELEVDYLLDFAELPAYAEFEKLDTNHDNTLTPTEQNVYLDAFVAQLLPAVSLTANGAPVPLRAVFRGLSAPPGQNGMSTLRIAVELRGRRPEGGGPIAVVLVDRAFSDHGGWRELEALDSAYGAVTESSQAKGGRRAGAQLAYPGDGLAPPPREDELSTTFGPVAGTPADRSPVPALDARGSEATDGRVLADLVREGTWSWSFLLFALAMAFALGAGHALSPGHGKTLVAAYLIGRRSRVRDAIVLGATVTATHTASVFVLGLSALMLERTVGTEAVLRGLGIVSGVLVSGIALAQMPGRVRRLLGREGRREEGSPDAAHDGTAPHAHGGGEVAPAHHHGYHHHGDGHWHSHAAPNGRSSMRSLVALGISGGLVPCPGGLVVILTAISLHRMAFGLCLLVAFSLGLATVLSSVAVLFVVAKDRLDRVALDSRLVRAMPVFSSTVVLILGAVIALQNLIA